MFFNRVLQTCVIGLAKFVPGEVLKSQAFPCYIFESVSYRLCYICSRIHTVLFDTDKSSSSSYFQVFLMLFIRNDQCCSKLFSHTEKFEFSCSRNEQNCATFPLLTEQAGAGGLQQKVKLLSSSHCELSCSLTDPVMGTAAWIQDFSMRGGVSASFALLKVFVSKLDPAGGRICEFPCLIFVVVWKDSALLLGHCKVALFFYLFFPL